MTDLCDVDIPTAFADAFDSELKSDNGIGYTYSLSIVSPSKYPELSLFTEADTGVNFGSAGSFSEYTIRNDNSPDTIDDGGYARDRTFIVANTAFKANDHIPKDDLRRVPNNEITWQSFAKAAKKKTNNLKVIYLRNIQNKGMWAIAQTNYAERGINLDQVAVWDQSTPQMATWFERFIGSDNASGKLLALTNHHTGAGNKKLSKVITIPKQVTGSQGMFTAALVLA